MGLRARSAALLRASRRAVVLLVEGGRVHARAAGARAAELGMPAVAMTDRDGLYGAARFVRACEREGVRPILGASLTVRAPARAPARRPRRAAGRRRHRVREPVPAHHRRAHAGGARRPLARPRADLRARRRDGRRCSGPRSHPGAWPWPARIDAAARVAGAASARPSARDRLRRGRRAPDGARTPPSEIRAMLRLAERADVARGGHEPGPLPRAARTRSSPTRSSACAGSSRRRPPTSRRANAEGFLKPPEQMRCAVRASVRISATPRWSSPSACTFDLGAEAGPLPGLPDAGGPLAPTRCSPSGAGAASHDRGMTRGRRAARPPAPRARR